MVSEQNDKVDRVIAAFNQNAVRDIGLEDLEILLATITTSNDLRKDNHKKERENVLAVFTAFLTLRKNIEAADESKVSAMLKAFADLRDDAKKPAETSARFLARIDKAGRTTV